MENVSGSFRVLETDLRREELKMIFEKCRLPEASFSHEGKLCDTKEYIKPPARKK